MKTTLTSQLKAFTEKYGWIGTFLYKNMRLALLLVFAALSGYLVFRINKLVNTLPEAPNDTSLVLQKTPNKEVLNIFPELKSHDVRLDSSFETGRDRPF